MTQRQTMKRRRKVSLQEQLLGKAKRRRKTVTETFNKNKLKKTEKIKAKAEKLYADKQTENMKLFMCLKSIQEQNDKQTDRQKNRQTERQTGTLLSV